MEGQRASTTPGWRLNDRHCSTVLMISSDLSVSSSERLAFQISGELIDSNKRRFML